MLGAYSRESELKVLKWGAFSNLSVYLGVGVFCVFISIVANYLDFSKDVYSYISPLQIIQTVYLFLFCKALTIKKGKYIILFFSLYYLFLECFRTHACPAFEKRAEMALVLETETV